MANVTLAPDEGITVSVPSVGTVYIKWTYDDSKVVIGVHCAGNRALELRRSSDDGLNTEFEIVTPENGEASNLPMAVAEIRKHLRHTPIRQTTQYGSDQE